MYSDIVEIDVEHFFSYFDRQFSLLKTGYYVYYCETENC